MRSPPASAILSQAAIHRSKSSISSCSLRRVWVPPLLCSDWVAERLSTASFAVTGGFRFSSAQWTKSKLLRFLMLASVSGLPHTWLGCQLSSRTTFVLLTKDSHFHTSPWASYAAAAARQTTIWSSQNEGKRRPYAVGLCLACAWMPLQQYKYHETGMLRLSTTRNGEYNLKGMKSLRIDCDQKVTLIPLPHRLGLHMTRFMVRLCSILASTD